MFKLFSRKKESLPVQRLAIRTDIHSHILPGLDDGSPNMETSLELVRGLMSLGFDRLVATPHVIGDMYRNTPQTINAALGQLKAACIQHSLDINITAAAEYMLDDYFLNLIRSKQPLLTIRDNIILTEFSYASPIGNLHEIAFEIQTSNYKPILAHPERYFYYHSDYEQYETLKEYGFLFQVNLLSLTGYYGSPVAKAARWLFEKGMVDFVGTDLHHERHLANVERKENLSLINKYLEGAGFNEGFYP